MPSELEICIACDDLNEALHNARAAVSGGANRLECCAQMASGGLTPDSDIIEAICRELPAHVAALVMVRPRDGSFEWSAKEEAIMMTTIDTMAAAGAQGIVSGALTGGKIDADLTSRLIGQTHMHGLQFTFHRAIDATDERQEAIQHLVESGCDRVLTSGTHWESGLGATDGREELESMANLMDGHVELVIGGGISSRSLRYLLPTFQDMNQVSFHAFSSVLKDGKTNNVRVRELRDLLDNPI